MQPDALHVVIVTRAVAPLHGVGGLERHTHDLIRHLLGRGVRVTLVTAPSQSASDSTILFSHERLHVRRVPYWTFPFAGRRGTTVIDRSTAYLWFGRRAGRLAAELVRAGGIQIVHGMGAAALGYATARRDDWYGTVPFVFNPHGMEEFGSTGGLSGLKALAYAPLRKAVRLCAHAADRVIATDRALVPVVHRHLGIADDRISIVPNAVDLEEIDRHTDPAQGRALRERHGLSSTDVLLLAVARLEENKGFQHLIAALSQMASVGSSGRSSLGARWRCVILGDGSARGRLERDIAAAGLAESIVLPGHVGDTELHAWYEAATLFVHPTLYEGSSIATLEAMAHRRAVVASEAGGIPDKIRPGVNGWLVPPADAAALGNAIEVALSSPERLTRMGEASRAVVEQEFSWTAAVSRLLEVYHDVLAAGRRAAAC